MAKHPDTFPYTSWKGLNNISNPENTSDQFLKKALNINLDKTGNISKRKGYTKKINGNFTSLWASENGLGCYGVLNGDLVSIYSDYTTSVIQSVGSERLSFEEIDGIIYYNSNTTNGIIVIVNNSIYFLE